MGLDYVDIFYSHLPDPETPLEETMGALDTAVRQGKTLYVGISNYKPIQTKEALRILKNLGTPCLIHQPSYSMLNRWVEERLLDVLEEEGVGCITYSPLAQGLLTDKYLNGIPKDSRATNPDSFLNISDITEGLINKLKALNALALERGQTLAQMAIAWLLREGRVTSVLVGASKPEQIEDNVNVLGRISFTDDELEGIETILTSGSSGS